MIRILIVDDQLEADFMENMCRSVSGSFGGTEVLPLHINPVGLLSGPPSKEAVETLLRSIAAQAEEFWDVIIIDVNLAEVPLPEPDRIHLSLFIAERVREKNHAATLILYSGTLSDHVDKLLKAEASSEAALKRIFRAEIASFVPRRRIENEVVSAIDNPSWLLRVDRLLMTHAKICVAVEEAEFKGRTFGDLAKSVRRQDRDGQRIAELTAKYGVSCFADLNS
jgi:hypothetical protein